MYKIANHIAIEENKEMECRILLDLENGVLFQLNDTASALLECIANNALIDDCINDIAHSTGEERSCVSKDIYAYLDTLVEKGYLLMLE